jgi:hypothetical protein
MPTFLRKSIGPWSAGTRVEILRDNPQGFGYVMICVLARDKPVIEVLAEDLVERGEKLGRRSQMDESGAHTEDA